MTNDLPSERPLADQARARRKADLLRDITEEHRTGRRWLVPALAAASVVAVVAVGGAVMAGGEDPKTDNGGPAGPGPTSPPSEPVPPSDESSVPASEPAAPETVPGEVTFTQPVDEPGFPVQASEGCADLWIPVPGASEVAAIALADTTVRLYGNGSRWIVCDEWAALDGGVATLFHPHAYSEPLNKSQLGISMNFSMDDPDIGEYVAGGVLPDGVESITYTFADGHVEEAVLDGDLWAMAYFAKGQAVIHDATVEVVAGGAAQQFTLRAPEDFCNQSNHGC